MIAESSELLQSVDRLTKDIRQSAITLSRGEARFLVDAYYIMQENRIRSEHQVRALGKISEPHSVLDWLAKQSEVLEKQIARALDAYSAADAVGAWSRSVKGIGPVIAAGLLAHIDIEKAPTVGHIWRFAGLDPTFVWGKGEKRPWNATLKTLCWKIGESFVKQSGREDDTYGHLWAERKVYEEQRNDSGGNAERAAQILAEKRIGKDTDAYKALASGKLPKAQIHARAKRWAVKLFLSHWHAVAYRQRFGTEPPLPYPIAILGHAHMR